MEFVGIEKQLFEELVRKFEYFEHRVMIFATGRTTGRCTSGWTIRTYASI